MILDGSPIEVIGIVRPEHTFPDGTDVWLNMTWGMQIQSRQARWMSAVGRLGDGQDLDAARADMIGVAARVEQANPDSNRGWTVTMESLHSEMVGDTRTALLVLLGATGLILLIACANVANLLLSRSEARSREIAVRVAFGAGRGRLARQLVTESLVLAGIGALLGLGLAQLGVRGLLALAPVTLPRGETVSLDGTVLGAVAGVSVVTGLLFGLAPLVRLLRSEVHASIRDGDATPPDRAATGCRTPSSWRSSRWRSCSSSARVCWCAPFENVRAVDPGFASGGVLTVELDVSTSVAASDQEVTDFYEQLEQRIAELPGVTSVGNASTLPLGEDLDYFQEVRFVDREGRHGARPPRRPAPRGPGFFAAMRTPIVSGRDFTPMDRNDAPGAVIVNETFARMFYGQDDPIGEKIGDMRMRLGPLGGIHLAGGIEESEVVGS